MTAALAVVCCAVKESAVVVVENKMLAFVANDIWNSRKFFRMNRDYNCAGMKRYDHTSCINRAAFVVFASGILVCCNCQIGRVFAGLICEPVRFRDVNQIVLVLQAVTKSELSFFGNREEVIKRNLSPVICSARAVTLCWSKPDCERMVVWKTRKTSADSSKVKHNILVNKFINHLDGK